MNAEEFTRRKTILHAFRALVINPAYLGELLPLIERHRSDAIAGLRNRNIPRERRDEYLQAAEDADELAAFVEKRIATLEAELRLPPTEMQAGDEE